MNDYEPLLRIDLAHGYYGDAPIPVSIRPADAQDAQLQGLAFHPDARGARVASASPAGSEHRFSVQLVADGLMFLQMTDGIVPGRIRKKGIKLDGDSGQTAEFSAMTTAETSGPVGLLAVLDITVTGAGDRTLTVNFNAVAGHWVYHIANAGRSETLRVFDTDGEFEFRNLGSEIVGSRLLTKIASLDPIPLSLAAMHRFRLLDVSGGMVRTLAALPHASRIDREDGGSPVSDIYVHVD